MHKVKEYIQNKTKSIYLNFNTRLIILSCSLIVLVLLSTLCITHSINTNKKIQINYKSDSQLRYKVYLKENDFYETKYLEEDMTYVSSLIDYIEVNYSDLFDIDKNSNIDYHYKVMASIVITPKTNNSKILFKKDYVILDGSNSVNSEDNYKLTKQIKIDYDEYNKVANDFKMTYGLECESKLIVTKVLLTSGKESDYSIEFNDVSENSLTIPLSERQITIAKKVNKAEQHSNITTAKAFIENKVLFVLGLLLTVLIVCNVYLVLKLVKTLKPRKDKYQKELKKILNEYDRMIVNVNRMPDLSDHDVYKVAAFTELIDVRDNLKIPISFVKISEEKSCFYIKDSKIIYIYYLKSVDL